VGMTALRRFESALPADDKDSVVKALQGLLLWFREPSSDSSDEMTLTRLASAYLEAEQPPAAEAHAMRVAVKRATDILGDLPAAAVDATALRRLADGMATTPYQKQKQPLHRSGREATLKAIEGLLRWHRDGGPERAAHADELRRASESIH